MEPPLQGALLLLMFSQNLLAAQCTSHTSFLPSECFVRRYKPEGLSSLKSIDVLKVTVTVLPIFLYHYEPRLWLHLRSPFIRCIEHCILNTNTMVVLKCTR